MIGIALIVFSSVLLIVSIYYIRTNTRHKEHMAMIEKGMKPETSGSQFFLETLKLAFGFVGGGVGFLLGVTLENSGFFDSSIELPLYFAPILICTGLSLALFYSIYKNHLKK